MENTPQVLLNLKLGGQLDTAKALNCKSLNCPYFRPKRNGDTAQCVPLRIMSQWPPELPDEEAIAYTFEDPTQIDHNRIPLKCPEHFPKRAQIALSAGVMQIMSREMAVLTMREAEGLFYRILQEISLQKV